MGDYQLPSTIIRHRGFFEINNVVKAIQGWFGGEDYSDYNINELSLKPGTFGYDGKLIAKGEKKVTEYVKFHIEVVARVWNVKDVEMIQDGKKIKTQEGQIQAEVMGKLEVDWQKRFKSDKTALGKITKWLSELLEKRILKYKIGDYWEDMAIADEIKLVETIRRSLGQEL